MNTSVLYISPHRDGTGYANAAINYMLALDYVNIPVNAQFIRLTHNDKSLPPQRILELEKNKVTPTAIVQHLLPEFFVKNGPQRHIGMFALETDSIPYKWLRSLKLMDDIVVYSTWQQKILAKYNIPSHVVPHAVDLNIFFQNYKPLPRLEKFREQHKTLFYSIGANTKRKHFIALLKAFMLEFGDYEDVGLVIKSDKTLFRNSDMTWSRLIEQVRNELNIHRKLKNICVIDDFLNDKEIYQLHNMCDIYVCSSYGEAQNIPCQEALGFGKTPVVPNHTCFSDYINEDNGYLVRSYKTPAFANDNPHQQGYWWDIEIPHLQERMREACNCKSTKQSLGIQSVEQFSFEHIGFRLREILCQNSKM